MQPFMNLAPEVYEAIIAAFIVVGLTQSFVLRRKWHQAESLKKVIASIGADATALIMETSKALIESAMITSLKVAGARAEAEAAQRALKSANARVNQLETQIAISDEAGEAEEARFRFGSPGPFTGERVDPARREAINMSLRAGNPDLFAQLFGKGLTPTGRSIRPPKVQVFRVSPRGPATAADFLKGASGPTGKAPTLVDILSLLAGSLPRHPGKFDDPPRPGHAAADETKADVFQYDDRTADDRTADVSTFAAPQKAPQGALELPGTPAGQYSPERYEPTLRAG